MVAAGYVVEFVFGGLGLVPDQSTAKLPDDHVTWNYTARRATSRHTTILPCTALQTMAVQTTAADCSGVLGCSACGCVGRVTRRARRKNASAVAR